MDEASVSNLPLLLFINISLPTQERPQLTWDPTVYIFLGTLLLGSKLISNIAGGAVGIVGIGYIALEFLPSIEPPSNMREAEVAGWGAEQV